MNQIVPAHHMHWMHLSLLSERIVVFLASPADFVNMFVEFTPLLLVPVLHNVGILCCRKSSEVRGVRISMILSSPLKIASEGPLPSLVT